MIQLTVGQPGDFSKSATRATMSVMKSFRKADTKVPKVVLDRWGIRGAQLKRQSRD